MAGWIVLSLVTIAMYRIAENDRHVGWLWAAVTVGIFFALGALMDVPGFVNAGLAGVLSFSLLFVYKVVADR